MWWLCPGYGSFTNRGKHRCVTLQIFTGGAHTHIHTHKYPDRQKKKPTYWKPVTSLALYLPLTCSYLCTDGCCMPPGHKHTLLRTTPLHTPLIHTHPHTHRHSLHPIHTLATTYLPTQRHKQSPCLSHNTHLSTCPTNT